jgi:hypothetical protein
MAVYLEVCAIVIGRFTQAAPSDKPHANSEFAMRLIKASITRAMQAVKEVGEGPQRQRWVLLPTYGYFEARRLAVLAVVGSGITENSFKRPADEKDPVVKRILTDAHGQALEERFAGVVAALRSAIAPFVGGPPDAIIDGNVVERFLRESEESVAALFRCWSLSERREVIPKLQLRIPDVTFPIVVVKVIDAPPPHGSE